MSFKEDIGDTLLEATNRNQDDDAVVLMRAAEIIIQNEIFQLEYRFNGSLLDEQYDNHSTSLLALVQKLRKC